MAMDRPRINQSNPEFRCCYTINRRADWRMDQATD